MAGELIKYDRGFYESAGWSEGDQANWFNRASETRYGVGHPYVVYGKSYYSAIFNDAYYMVIYGGTGSSYTASNSLYVGDNDTALKGLQLGSSQVYNIHAAAWCNWGGDNAVSYTYRAFHSGTFKAMGASSTGRHLKVCGNFGVNVGAGTAASYAVGTKMTVGHYIMVA